MILRYGRIILPVILIQMIKQNRLDDAAELIKTTSVSSKFPGLVKRRMREYKKFIGEA